MNVSDEKLKDNALETKKTKHNHRKKIHTEVKNDLIQAGFSEEIAIELITAIKDDLIQRLTIDY